MAKRINYCNGNVVHAVKATENRVGGFVDFLCDTYICISRKSQIPLTDKPVTCLACLAEGGESWVNRRGSGFFKRGPF